MSVDVTNPDAMPIRVRPRSRGAQAASFSHDLPTLLRVPNVRPPSSVAVSQQGMARVESVVSTDVPPSEASPDNSPEVGTDPSIPAHEAAASTNDVDGEREWDATADISTLEHVKGKTIDAVSRFARRWKSQLGTFGVIVTAVIVCALVVQAMRQDDFGASPSPELTAKSAAGDAVAEQQPIEVTNLDAHDDRIASDTSNTSAGHADSYYANSPPADGASGPEQNNQRPSAPLQAALGSTPPSNSTQPGAASNTMDPHDLDQQRWASSPAERPTRFALNQTLPQGPFAGSAASQDSSKVPPNAAPLDPSGLWPAQIVDDNNRAGFQRPTPHAARYPANAPAGSAQPPSRYPTTDPSRYGSFDDLKTALIERKLERDEDWRVGNSRSRMPTLNANGTTDNLGLEANTNRGGGYR